MWKIVAGFAVVALAALLLLMHDKDQDSTEQTSQQPASSPERVSEASRPDDSVKPQFTSYEAPPTRRITKSTTGTIVVFPNGARTPQK